ncbi:18495_t:CDS:1, partial [Racocetra fulgida]
TDSLQTQSIPTNSTRFKLLNVHQNITKNLKETPIIQTPPLATSSHIEPSVKRKRSEETDKVIDLDFTDTIDDHKSETNEADPIKTDQEESEKLIKKNKSQKNYTHTQIKERPIRTKRGPKKSCHTTVEDVDSNKE